MKYELVVGASLEVLEMQVNECLEVGFEPCGSIFGYDDRILGRCIIQPMLKQTNDWKVSSKGARGNHA